jgi:hypothetical protein
VHLLPEEELVISDVDVTKTFVCSLIIAGKLPKIKARKKSKCR